MMLKANALRWKIGFHTWSFVSIPLKEALRRIRDAGYTEVEITADRTHLDPRVFSPSRLPSLKSLLKDLGLHPNSVHAPIKDVDIAAQNPDVRVKSIKLIMKTLEYCRSIECPILVLHPNGEEGASLKPDDSKKNLIDSLTQIVKKAEDLGVNIAIENMIDVKGRRFGSRVSHIREVIESIGSPSLGICFDTGHVNLFSDPNISMDGEIFEAGEYLMTLHVHDNNGMEDEHKPPGDGSINWSQVIEALKKVNYAGVFMMEVQESDDPDATAKRCLEAVTKMIMNADG
ncbi:hypothetical protein DRO64_09235 [Candidatus Bathyarchaeota archaeon]|nr:MAG: hypothetical protein DRO64_09235 [Candidatus Bathyarchaeota archaeon]